MTERDLSIIKSAIHTDRRLPSERQAIYLVKLVRRLRAEGLTGVEGF